MKFLRSNSATIYSWTILLGLPLFFLGWTIGHIGPASDDWVLLHDFLGGHFFWPDPTRPLGLSYPIAYLIAGGNLNLVFLFNILLTGLAGILLFEISKRLFAEWLGPVSVFAGLLVALVYILYPANVSRHWLIMIHDAVSHVFVLLAGLIWIIALKRDKPQYLLFATGLSLVALLGKETPIFLFVLFPLIFFYFGLSPWKKRWIGYILLWYLMLVGYFMWRFWLLPTSQPVARAPNEFALPEMAGFQLRSIYRVFFDVFRRTFREDWITLYTRDRAYWVFPVAVVLAIVIVIAGWFILKDRRLGGKFVSKYGVMLVSFSFLAVVAALAPYSALGRTAVRISGTLSRETSMASIGASLLFVAVPIAMIQIAASLKYKDRFHIRPYAGLLLSAIICVFVLTASIIRQVKAGDDWVQAWQLQRNFWHRVLELNISFKSGQLVIFQGFPESLGHALLATDTWAYEPAMYILYRDLAPNVSFLPLERTESWSVENGQLIATVEGKQRVYRLEDTIVLSYNATDCTVYVSQTLPNSIPRNGTAGIKLADIQYTIDKSHHNATEMALRLLNPWSELGVCPNASEQQNSSTQ